MSRKYTAHDWKVVAIDWGKEFRVASHQSALRAAGCMEPEEAF
ncbi:MAG: hypothetical protein ACRD7E_20045 [Bryobacteraceae bacterium]